MTSTKQIAANRRNAQKSTGPRTEGGKAVVSRNALKHGLLAKEVVVAGECPEDLDDLSQRLHAQLCPVGELEQLLVDRIIAGFWRLRRCLRQETAAIECQRRETSNVDDTEEIRRIRDARVAFGRQSLDPLVRYETAIERQIYRALHALERLQSARTDRPCTPCAAIQGQPLARPALPPSPQGPQDA